MDATCVRVADAEGRRFADVLGDSYAATVESDWARQDVARVRDALAAAGRDLRDWELARRVMRAWHEPGEFERERVDALDAIRASFAADDGGPDSPDLTPEAVAVIAEEIETLRKLRAAREASGTFAERFARARGRPAPVTEPT